MSSGRQLLEQGMPHRNVAGAPTAVFLDLTTRQGRRYRIAGIDLPDIRHKTTRVSPLPSVVRRSASVVLTKEIVMRVARIVSCVACLILGSSAAAVAQETAIAGIVKDASGAVVPGVTVEASSPAL